MSTSLLRWLTAGALAGLAFGCSERNMQPGLDPSFGDEDAAIPGPLDPNPQPSLSLAPAFDPTVTTPRKREIPTPIFHDGGVEPTDDGGTVSTLPACDVVESTAFDLCVSDDEDSEVDWESCEATLADEYPMIPVMKDYLVSCCRSSRPPIGPGFGPGVIPFDEGGPMVHPPAPSFEPSPSPDPGLLWCEEYSGTPAPAGLHVRSATLPKEIEELYNFSNYEVVNLEGAFDDAARAKVYEMIVTDMGGFECSELPDVAALALTPMSPNEFMSFLSHETARWVERIQGENLNSVENQLHASGLEANHIWSAELVSRMCGESLNQADGRFFFIWNETNKNVLFLTLHRTYGGDDRGDRAAGYTSGADANASCTAAPGSRSTLFGGVMLVGLMALIRRRKRA